MNTTEHLYPYPLTVTQSAWRRINRPSKSTIKELVTACVLCGGPTQGKGNNPWPLSLEGTCCDDCDDLKVTPVRMLRMGFSEAHARHTGELARSIRRKIRP